MLLSKFDVIVVTLFDAERLHSRFARVASNNVQCLVGYLFSLVQNFC